MRPIKSSMRSLGIGSPGRKTPVPVMNASRNRPMHRTPAAGSLSTYLRSARARSCHACTHHALRDRCHEGAASVRWVWRRADYSFTSIASLGLGLGPYIGARDGRERGSLPPRRIRVPLDDTPCCRHQRPSGLTGISKRQSWSRVVTAGSLRSD